MRWVRAQGFREMKFDRPIKRSAHPRGKVDSRALRTPKQGASPDSTRAGDPPQRPTAGAHQPAIRIVMMPRDVNPLGTIFGGLILSYIDLAGVVDAHRHSDKMLVTAAMHEVKFIAPVFVGDLVSFYSEVTKIGNTSITVLVTVEATRASAPHVNVRVTQAEVVYVAIDEAGKPISLRR